MYKASLSCKFYSIIFGFLEADHFAFTRSAQRIISFCFHKMLVCVIYRVH